MSQVKYQCGVCKRYFYIDNGERTTFDIDFGCPYGCDDAGRLIETEPEPLYVISEKDAQDVAGKEFDAKLTAKQMYMVKKGVESGLGNCWYDVMLTAVEEAIKE